MFTLRRQKIGIRQANRRRVDPISDQVRKVLVGVDQRLILMVRG